MDKTPTRDAYDVIIVGGAMIGSSCAWHLAANPDFDGRVLVVERDASLEFASTTGTNSCIREQFSNALNIRMSQYAIDYIANFREELGDPEAPEIAHHRRGYLFLAATEAQAAVLRENQAAQAACGAATELLTPEEIHRRYPFYDLDGILLGSINMREGYFDGAAMHPWWRRKARERGVEFVENEVVGIALDRGRVAGVTLKSGEAVACGTVVNAAGPRAAEVARMAGLDLPVEPRKRMTFVFDAATPPGEMPLSIFPDGAHCRMDGALFLTGCPPEEDVAVAYDDFAVEHHQFEENIWPKLARWVPAFEAVKVVNAWACHYAYNVFDHNAVVGPHPEVANFVFCNGFSGHGLQQSPAMGRGVAEWIAHGEYRALDLSPLGYDRIVRGEPFLEKAII